MNQIKLKLIVAKAFNTSLNFLKKNKLAFVKQIKKISSTPLVNKNLLAGKKLLVIKSMAVIIFFWIFSYPFISINVEQKTHFLK